MIETLVSGIIMVVGVPIVLYLLSRDREYFPWVAAFTTSLIIGIVWSLLEIFFGG